MGRVLLVALIALLIWPDRAGAEHYGSGGYDYDSRWIRRTLRPSHRHSETIGEHEHRFHKRQLYRRHHKPHCGEECRERRRWKRERDSYVVVPDRDRDRDGYTPSVVVIDKDRDRGYGGYPALPEARDGSLRLVPKHEFLRQRFELRTYGFQTFGQQKVTRDVMSNTGCLPHVDGMSRAVTRFASAYAAAVVDWKIKVRWMYGERFMDINSAETETMEKICGPVTVPETVTQRVGDGVAKAFGGDGIRWRCFVRIQPCPIKPGRNDSEQSKVDFRDLE